MRCLILDSCKRSKVTQQYLGFIVPFLAETLVVTSKEIGLDVNADKTKYMVMRQVQNAGRSHSIKKDNVSCENVEEFKYLGKNFTYQNSIQEEIKSTAI